MTPILSITAFDGDHPGHPFRGNGRTGGIAGNAEAVVNRMMAHVMDKNGVVRMGAGFTVDAHTNVDVKNGYAVAIFPSRSKVLDASKMAPAELKKEIGDWKEKNKALLNDPRNRFKVGGWVDPDTGKLWLDATRVYGEGQKGQATRMGKLANQISIAHLTSITKKDWGNAFINTGGTGEPKALPWSHDAKPSKPVLVLLEGTATVDEIHAALSKHFPKQRTR